MATWLKLQQLLQEQLILRAAEAAFQHEREQVLRAELDVGCARRTQRDNARSDRQLEVTLLEAAISADARGDGVAASARHEAQRSSSRTEGAGCGAAGGRPPAPTRGARSRAAPMLRTTPPRSSRGVRALRLEGVLRRLPERGAARRRDARTRGGGAALGEPRPAPPPGELCTTAPEQEPFVTASRVRGARAPARPSSARRRRRDRATSPLSSRRWRFGRPPRSSPTCSPPFRTTAEGCAVEMAARARGAGGGGGCRKSRSRRVGGGRRPGYERSRGTAHAALCLTPRAPPCGARRRSSRRRHPA